ncbi:MAG: hypothetical protein OEW88_08855 [Gammaproteobacteria bacterium]|nr:hypothetical protein [Gammaproteobacteria bacterium]MDH5276519.1 hypothetical protein [Gammaproteobacteria bacterium]
MLTIVYENMAALDRSEEADAVAVKTIGSMDQQNKAAMDREAMRQVLGSQLIRKLILK